MEPDVSQPAPGAGPVEGAQPIIVCAADIAALSPCCARAHEHGFRRGYRRGYRYALYDLARSLSDLIVMKVEFFIDACIVPWMEAGTDTDVREPPPRFRAHRHSETQSR